MNRIKWALSASIAYSRLNTSRADAFCDLAASSVEAVSPILLIAFYWGIDRYLLRVVIEVFSRLLMHLTGKTANHVVKHLLLRLYFF